MTSFEFRVDCEKIRGKARPRFNTYTKRVYTTPEDKAFEALIRGSYVSSDGLYFEENKYLRLEAELYFTIPKSYTKKRKLLCAQNKERPAKKPDADNSLLKSIADSLNEIAYKDDIQLIEMECKKFYTTEESPYMIIRLIEIGSK